MFLGVRSPIYHSSITIESLTYRVLLGTLGYSSSGPHCSPRSRIAPTPPLQRFRSSAKASKGAGVRVFSGFGSTRPSARVATPTLGHVPAGSKGRPRVQRSEKTAAHAQHGSRVRARAQARPVDCAIATMMPGAPVVTPELPAPPRTLRRRDQCCGPSSTNPCLNRTLILRTFFRSSRGLPSSARKLASAPSLSAPILRLGKML
jgi:hypothetical protein